MFNRSGVTRRATMGTRTISMRNILYVYIICNLAEKGSKYKAEQKRILQWRCQKEFANRLSPHLPRFHSYRWRFFLPGGGFSGAWYYIIYSRLYTSIITRRIYISTYDEGYARECIRTPLATITILHSVFVGHSTAFLFGFFCSSWSSHTRQIGFA